MNESHEMAISVLGLLFAAFLHGMREHLGRRAVRDQLHREGDRDDLPDPERLVTETVTTLRRRGISRRDLALMLRDHADLLEESEPTPAPTQRTTAPRNPYDDE